MKRSSILIILFVVVVIVILFYSMSGTGDVDYINKINQERVKKDDFMKNGEDSPFASDSTGLKPLNYFPPDPKYRIIADLEPVKSRKLMMVNMSDGTQAGYMEYAYAHFNLDGKKNKLLILEVMARGDYKGTLFLAFADETSTRETYGAGRYLDLKKTPGASTITLDFNQAYNPYCAYNESFSCPFPPPGNVLEVAILAGEKNFH